MNEEIELQVVRTSLQDARTCLNEFLDRPNVVASVAHLAKTVADAFANGSKVLVAGNGGSMADAMHFAEELTGRFRRDRRPLPAIALSDPTHLSCVSNDYGYEYVFSRLVSAYASPGDVLILLSTSGNSANLLRAAEAGRESQASVYGMLGQDGGLLKPLCDFSLVAPGKTSDRIQEIHMLCLHIVVEAVEALLSLS